MKAQEVCDNLRISFTDTKKHSIRLKSEFWDFGYRKTFECNIHVHGLPTGIVAGTGKSWQEAYNDFNSAFAKIAITALNEKYMALPPKEQL